MMTYGRAQEERFVSFTLGVLLSGSGFATLFVTFLKAAYAATRTANLLARPIGGISNLLYNDVCDKFGVCVVQWLWPWVSDVNIDDALTMFLKPSVIAGLALAFTGTSLLRYSKRLGTWVREEKELLNKEGIRESLKPRSHHQRAGDVIAGRDSIINQEISYHYSHPPNKPKYTLIVAAIGATATIIAALIGKHQ